VHRSSRRARFGVAVDGRGLTSHSGTAALRELADRIGLTDALSAAAAPVSAAGLIHEPGAVLRDLVVMLADGGDDFSAIETLRGQADLDGPVASDSTAWRRVAGNDNPIWPHRDGLIWPHPVPAGWVCRHGR